jgi:transketolase
MGQPVIYVLTHDSVFVGEDGPTHQPVEHLASLRGIPKVLVLRPADAEETVEAWAMALERREGPVVLALSRQNLRVFPKDDPDWKNTIRTGAYIVKAGGPEGGSSGAGGRTGEVKPDVVIIATGSEVGLALEAAELAAQAGGPGNGKKLRVVSMPSRELFESQPKAIQEALIPPGTRVVCCEAGVRMGWERWAKPGDIFSLDRFGESGPAAKVAEHLGFTAGALAALIAKQ